MKIMGKKKKVIVERMRERPDASEVSRLYSSNKKAKKLMGWEPDYGGKKGFEKALREDKNFLEGLNIFKGHVTYLSLIHI